MQAGRIPEHTRIVGKSQGYIGLPVRDELEVCKVNGTNTPVMKTAWTPTPKELEDLMAGAPVILTVLGVSHPPVRVETGDTPE